MGMQKWQFGRVLWSLPAKAKPNLTKSGFPISETEFVIYD